MGSEFNLILKMSTKTKGKGKNNNTTVRVTRRRKLDDEAETQLMACDVSQQTSPGEQETRKRQKRNEVRGSKLIDLCFKNVLAKERAEQGKKKEIDQVKQQKGIAIPTTSDDITDSNDSNRSVKTKYISQDAEQVAEELDRIERQFDMDDPDQIRVTVNVSEDNEFPGTDSVDSDGSFYCRYSFSCRYCKYRCCGQDKSKIKL